MPAARPAPAHQLPTAQPQPGQQAAGQAGPYQPATNSNAQPNAQPGVYQPVGNSKSQSAQPQRARKRVKQAAGAGTVLLALFSFVVLMGPLGPLQGFAPAAQQQHVQAGGAGAVNGALHGAGRVLMSLPSGSEHAPSNLNNSQLQSLSLGQSGHLPARLNDDHLQLPHDGRHVPHDVMSLMEGSAENDVALPVQRSVDVTLHVQEWWSSGADNASYDNSKSIMLRPSDKIAEQEALQGLKASLILVIDTPVL